MLRDIIRKEILDTVTSSKFVFTFLLCTVLILLSVFTGIQNYRAEWQEYNAAVALNRKNLESQPTYGALAGLGTKIIKTPLVLSTVVTGIQESVGRVATGQIAYDPTLVDSKYETNPVLAIFGALDLTHIVKIVLSLFAILFTFDAIVGEKERGTLKLALANSVPRYRLILGKAIGGFMSLIMPLIIPLLLGLIILAAYPGVYLTGDDWLRIGLLFLLFLLYLSVFFALGLFVSSRAQQSSTSLLILLFIWVSFVTIVPKASVMVAGQINRIPSVHEVTAEKEAFLQEIQGEAPQMINEWIEANAPPEGNESDAAFQQREQEWQARFRLFLEDIQQEMTGRIDDKNAALEEVYQAKRRKQQNLALNLSRVSPASSLLFGAMSLGRTGVHEHERFLNSVKAYKPAFTKWVNEKMIRSLNFEQGAEQPRPEVADMPVHEFQPESLDRSFARALPDYLVMTFLILLFFAGAVVSFLRYDVR